MYSAASWSSPCQSMSDLTHETHSSSPFAPLPRLYSQCAATPNSASSCISRVRSWISSGVPEGPITVVWSER